MRALRFLAASIAMLAGAFGTPASADGTAGQFDYYVLALSWSPTFCLNGKNVSPTDEQCGLDKHYAFIVHGLWPQYAKADANGHYWPQDCKVSQPRDVAATVREQVLPIMPSSKLIEHEWDKHGTCSGLSQADYFNTVQAAYKAITVPEAYQQVKAIQKTDAAKLEKAFLDVNAGLEADGISLQCNKRSLQEVRICLSKDLKFLACPGMRDRGCNGELTLPAKR
ncbi:ribonuclease T2 [Rhizobium oryzicola]|uniref:Ribonuclease T2 n=1 Tax=Rhizobium oryzicola TaxID=1232668 RepID=A0ABT8SV12_9HYPH|nr:ribonuclease T2 [Rhizobium oryzicola]MDO1581723.1 ribonuclease T2 [Rhizobium oryzicola]